jgi:predicted nucleic acid-binding Zn ribbon protein
MPVYEFECDNCGFISEKFYRSIPRIDPMQIVDVCINCKFRASHKKILSFNNFKLKGMGWSEDGYDKNAAPRVAELDEPSVI